jgi:hypothetical protein
MRIGAAGLVLVGGALCAPLTAQQLPIYRLGERSATGPPARP